MEVERIQQDASLTEPPVPPTEDERALSKKLLGEINSVLDSKEWKKYVEGIAKNREYVKGAQHNDDSGELVRANLIHPEIKALVSSVYAKDPEITITPSESVTADRYAQVKAFGKTLELVVGSQFKPSQANLKKYAKAAIRASATSYIGWLKVTYQKDYETDPEIKNRIRDVQDNIERIEHLGNIIDKDGENADQPVQASTEELKQTVKALQAQPEVLRAEGLVIDKPLTEDVLFSDDVMDSIDIEDAGWITQRIWMTVDRCVQRFGFCPSKSSRYAKDRSKAANKGSSEKDSELIAIFEVWHQVNNVVYTLIDGWEGYMRKPFTPSKVGERFHGFFPLIFDPVDGEPYPLALAEELRELADEHNEARTNFRHHRKHSIPMWIGIEGKITQKDARKIRDAESMEVVLVEGDEGQPIRNYLDQFQNPQIDPNVYSTEHIREDWERVTSKGDAARGSVSKAKTATEANILQQGLQVSNTEMQDIGEEWLREIAQYTAELVLQEMTIDQVRRIAGEEAVWPEMSKEDIFDVVVLNIRAGSSGKPDKAREQEQWIKFLPELRDTLLSIQQLEGEGADERADILRKLVEETLRRLDERIDIDEFFPKVDEQAEQQKKMQQQQQQQQDAQKQEQAMKLEFSRQIAEVRNMNADTFLKLEDAESKNAGRQLDKLLAYLGELDSQFQRDLQQDQQNRQPLAAVQ